MSKLEQWLNNGNGNREELRLILNMSEEKYAGRLSGRTEWKLPEIVTILQYTKADFHELF